MKIIGTRKMLKFRYGITDEDILKGKWHGYEIVVIKNRLIK